MTGRGEEYQEGVNTDGWVNLSRLLRRRASCNTEGFVSSLTDRCWDCFVAVLLAMTVGGLPRHVWSGLIRRMKQEVAKVKEEDDGSVEGRPGGTNRSPEWIILIHLLFRVLTCS